MTTKKISIVVPVYNEESIVKELISRLQKEADKHSYLFEFVVVDDGSRDNTLQMLLELQHQEPRLKIIKLSRNWGHQNAYNAGIDHALGNAVILMDGDLEDPPELISEFLKKWEEGFHVVYAVKISRQESPVKRFFFSLFYRLMRTLSDVPVDKQSGMFSLLDERALHHLRGFKEKNKYYVGLRSFVGFRQTAVQYHRDRRLSGKPKQTFKRLLTYALNAFFSFSFLPIRMLTTFGFLIMLAIILLSFWLIIVKLFGIKFGMIQDLPGWTTLILLSFFIIGLQTVFMGILGEYIARILDEVRNRPYYLVEQVYDAGTAGSTSAGTESCGRQHG